MRCGETAVSYARHMSLSILLEMELATLPGGSGECFSKGFSNPLAIIDGDSIRSAHAPYSKALNECSPMLRCFRKRGWNTQRHAPPGFSFDTNGNKYSTLTYDVIPSHLGIGGIEEKMGNGWCGAIAPFLTKRIELGAALANISGREPFPPQISFITLATLRVETPCRYISAIARLRALSISEPLSNPGMMGVKGVCAFHTCGTSRVICPVEVRMVRGLNPLRRPFLVYMRS